jgi:hypothetical protein
VYLQLLGLGVGILSALVGYSNKFLFVARPWIVRPSQAYTKLLSQRELTNHQEIRDLLTFTRGDIAQYDKLKEFAVYGLMRRWAEVARLTLEPGKIDQRPEYFFAVMHPIYGYTKDGAECLVAGSREFHELYLNRFRNLQQRTAFLILSVSFFFQFLGILLTF